MFPNSSSYDPDISHDGISNFGGELTQVRTKANFDLTITNGTTANKTVELFNFLRSFTKVKNATYAAAAGDANFGYYPLQSVEGLTAFIHRQILDASEVAAQQTDDTDTAVTTGWVGFNQNGDLLISGALHANGYVKISSSTFPYRGLFESSNVQPFVIRTARMTFLEAAQIDNELTYFSNSFVGGSKTNRISPRSYFNPSQFQSLIVDVPLDCEINGQSGLSYTVNDDTTVKMILEVEGYSLLRANT